MNNEFKALAGVRIDKMNGSTITPGEPTKPTNLGKYAEHFWNTYVPQLVELGVAGAIDTPSLMQLATYFGVWMETAERLHDVDLAKVDGCRLLSANLKAYDAFRRLAVMYGMTALARTSLDMKPRDQEEDDFIR